MTTTNGDSRRTPVVHKAEHVGSFLRTPAIHEARAAWKAGQLSDAGLREVEDREIEVLVEQQLDNGVLSVSDGEFRREYFHLDFIQHLDGITIKSNTLTGAKDDAVPPSISVTGKLRHVKPIEVDNFRFLQDRLRKSKHPKAKDAVIKYSIPSPTMVHFRGGRASIDIEAYPSMDEFFEDLAECWRREIKALADAGCTFIQLDDTNLAYLCDLKMREAAAGRGEDLNTLPRQYASLINAAVRDRPEGVTIAVHCCRGNYRSRHFAEGGYEPIAEVLFKELNVDTYFLEFDTERAGTFEPLRFLPRGHKTVVLGLISSKFPELEDKAAIIDRIRQASEYVPLDQLAVSPQCGYSSTSAGNAITVDDQWAKQRLVAEVAKDVWG